MTDPNRRILLSLKPRFANAILGGTKTVELRRTRPRIEVPTDALLYSSSPVCAIVGLCRVLDIVGLELSSLWRRYGSRADVSADEFRSYFEGCRVGYGLVVDRPKRLAANVDLATIRTSWRDFQPPQSFRYLTTPRSDEVLALA